MNKKFTAMLLSAAILGTTGLFAVTAFAEGETASIPVRVTICDEGKLALACKTVQVADLDSDGKYTVDEALYAAHEAYYEGGAAAGYASGQSDWGLSLKKLWGVANGGSYGYYVNNIASNGLADEVHANDYINAFSYTDAATCPDRYCYFDVNEITDAKQGDEKTLKLMISTYDENWSPVTLPAKNAVITVNGEKTSYQTDENGSVTVKFDKAGDLILSATSDTDILVPAALCVAVAAAETEPAPAETTAATDAVTTAESAAETTAVTSGTSAKTDSGKTGSGSSTSTDAAKTGDTAAIPALAVTALFACGTAYALRKRND